MTTSFDVFTTLGEINSGTTDSSIAINNRGNVNVVESIEAEFDSTHGRTHIFGFGLSNEEITNAGAKLRRVKESLEAEFGENATIGFFCTVKPAPSHSRSRSRSAREVREANSEFSRSVINSHPLPAVNQALSVSRFQSFQQHYATAVAHGGGNAYAADTINNAVQNYNFGEAVRDALADQDHARRLQTLMALLEPCGDAATILALYTASGLSEQDPVTAQQLLLQVQSQHSSSLEK